MFNISERRRKTLNPGLWGTFGSQRGQSDSPGPPGPSSEAIFPGRASPTQVFLQFPASLPLSLSKLCALGAPPFRSLTGSHRKYSETLPTRGRCFSQRNPAQALARLEPGNRAGSAPCRAPAGGPWALPWVLGRLSPHNATGRGWLAGPPVLDDCVTDGAGRHVWAGSRGKQRTESSRPLRG